MHPILSLGIGQGRAGLRRSSNTSAIPLPKQDACSTNKTHVPRASLPLPEPLAQSQENV